MPNLAFRLKKRPDANVMLTLVRDDGTFTNGPLGPAAGYGPVHDLAHYVVESTLSLSEGFLGLVASGWAIGDFEMKGAAGVLPHEALFAEGAAGELSRQEMMHQPSTAEEFNWALGAMLAAAGRTEYAQPHVDAATLDTMRATLIGLRRRWNELPPSATLELSFHSARRSNCVPPAAPGQGRSTRT